MSAALTLSQALSRYFSGRTRARGESYLGRVRLERGGPRRVTALVQGTELYQVQLDRDGDVVSGSCQCPAFDSGPCKHLYATLIVAERKGLLLGDGPPHRGMRFDDGLAIDDEPDGDGLAVDDGPDDEPFEDESAPRVIDPALRRLQAAHSHHPLSAPSPRAKSRGGWRHELAGLRDELTRPNYPATPTVTGQRELLYVLDVPSILARGKLTVATMLTERKKDGEWGKPKPFSVDASQVGAQPDPLDREILALLLGARSSVQYGWTYQGAASYELAQAHVALLLPKMARSGRLRVRTSQDAPLEPLAWHDDSPYELRHRLRANEEGGFRFGAYLRRADEELDLSAPLFLAAGGVVVCDGRVSHLDDRGAFHFVPLLRRNGELPVPEADALDFVAELLSFPGAPAIDLPEALRLDEIAPTPRPRLSVKAPSRRQFGAMQDRLGVELSFDYAGLVVDAEAPSIRVVDRVARRIVRRDSTLEAAAVDRIHRLGVRAAHRYSGPDTPYQIASRNLPQLVAELTAENWHVEAQGKLYRRANSISMAVRSGIDWFELAGGVQFDGQVAPVPELLAALARGDGMVRLGDGSFGVLPTEWISKYTPLGGLGRREGDALRFSRAQVGFLDALLSAEPTATFDEGFRRARDELAGFEGVAAETEGAGFAGALRPYQREGLGWLRFLERFGFGGCLADDMGLGKTVQVLALLESRRALRARSRRKSSDGVAPSLVVVPRSLVWNWKDEAARFAPKLRVLDHSGAGRPRNVAALLDYDLILTTYGTLRRDAALLSEVRFDYAILDEAQAVKNASTESAKAARLLRADHRLALSGTPVENHLGELWSLFEFLNPGLLGRAEALSLDGTGGRTPSPETVTLLARALRPYILRRTKDQVARDLPAKFEQTIHCELSPVERRRYDELRDHYRRALLDRVDREGMARAKIQILEALLRLRQAACHPGLLEPAKRGDSSAKLDALLPQITQICEEGHKALVFSQFTSLLSIVRARLDDAKVSYEYLDGRTKDRAARVERFQTDPGCRLFLISLKAGGVGLNLTAADYVFLLDPWWNPAVEAQAIDRTHRIGQTKKVFAYRLIARDTVEEKVLALQETKRRLAEAIITADNSVIRSLQREDLELLLS